MMTMLLQLIRRPPLWHLSTAAAALPESTFQMLMLLPKGYAGAGVSNFGNDAGDINDFDLTPEGDDNDLLPTDAEVTSETRFSPIVNISITGRYLIPT